uniref:Globin family profile domain-containing protein n=1 Tax=Acanthochromis polyacanthus TaxID=80966 RepID=A0A3Q1F3E4_9TELE
MAVMDAKNEIMDILQKVWTKLQGLPQATSLELGAFFVLVLFVGEFSDPTLCLLSL